MYKALNQKNVVVAKFITEGELRTWCHSNIFKWVAVELQGKKVKGKEAHAWLHASQQAAYEKLMKMFEDDKNTKPGEYSELYLEIESRR